MNHDGERFSDIVKKVRFSLFPDASRRLNWDEEMAVVEAVVDYHVRNSVSGRTLCAECHGFFHSKRCPAIRQSTESSVLVET